MRPFNTSKCESLGHLRAVLFASAATTFLWAPAAFAQESGQAEGAATVAAAGVAEDDAEASGERSTDIVVTAQRRSENLMDVPVAISAYTGETLNKVGVEGVQALQIATPAVVYPITGAYAQPYIRGIGSRLLQNGLDPSVAAYIDGRYISRQAAMNFDFVDIERVEVLKGPQGVLFGRNASAGAIRVLTKDVEDYFNGFVRAGFGNYDQWNVSGAVNAPLSENLGIRVSGITSHRDGYATNIVPGGRSELDDKNFSSLRAKILWQPTPNLDIRLTGSYWRAKDNAGNENNAIGPLQFHSGISSGGVTGVGRNEVATALSEPNDRKEYATELDIRLDLGGVNLQSITNYADFDGYLVFDGDGTSSRIVDATVFDTAKTFSQELQLSSDSSGPFEWIVGAFYFRDNVVQDTTVDVGARIISNGRQRVITEAMAAFGQVRWSITDQFALTVGGRYSHDEKELDLFQTLRPGTVTIPPTPYSDAQTFSKFTPAVTLEYTFDDTLMYTKFARGFKSGGYNYPPINRPILRPEVLDMYEVGLKTDLFSRDVRLTLSGYYYDYKDLQVTRAAAGAGVVVVTQNASNAVLYGIDADLTWFVTPELTITGALAWQHSEYQDYAGATAKVFRRVIDPTSVPNGMVDVVFPNADGHQLLRAPSFSAFISANYDIPIGRATMPFTVSYAYKGSYDFDFIYDPPGAAITNTTSLLRQEAYSLVNARLAYEPASEKWSIAAWVNNLTDKVYFDDVVAAGPGLRGSFGAPRTYGLELTVRF